MSPFHPAVRSSDLRVPLLDLLSRPLFRELQFERHRTSLCKLPVLKALLEAPDIQTLEVMHSTSNSLCQLVAAAQDIIFLERQPCLFFVFEAEWDIDIL